MANGNEEFLSVSNFKVSLQGGTWEVYESVSGLGLEMEDIPFQADRNQLTNRPGRCNAHDIVLTRRFKKDKELYNWMKATKDGKQDRKSGSVVLMDDESKEVARFNFFGAWPKAWHGPTLSKQSDGNDILLESVVLSVSDLEMG
jgi:phage tail-like protein